MKKWVNAVRTSLFRKLVLILILSVLVPFTLQSELFFMTTSTEITSIAAELLEENLQYNKQSIESYMKSLDEFAEGVIAYRKTEQLHELTEPGQPLQAYQFVKITHEIAQDLGGKRGMVLLPPGKELYRQLTAAYPLQLYEGFEPVIEQALQANGRPSWIRDDSGVGDLRLFRLIRSTVDFTPLAVLVVTIPGSELKDRLKPLTSYKNAVVELKDPLRGISVASGMQNANSAVLLTEKTTVSVLREQWVLTGQVPESDLLHFFKRLRSISFLLVGGTVAFIAAMILGVAHRFTAPIAYVVRMMKRIPDGFMLKNSQYQDREDELGTLVRGYQEMLMDLQRLLEKEISIEALKSRMEMQMLVHQINPHFLYNTFDAIKWKAKQGDSAVVTELITNLTDLLRYSINNNDLYTSVEREIAHVKSFVSIQLARHSHSFKIFYKISPQLYTRRILKLTIQPLVENAIKHGVAKLQPGKGKILVSITEGDGFLQITVEDNGPGFPGQYRIGPPPSESEQGVGLYNVDSRIRHEFGPKYGVTIGTSIGKGALVTVMVPFMENKQKERG
ncbi:MAG: histidine kinase [Paenibacillus sp.]|jgi:signal transduction histidine kinase|nr:histidine kinase [Paenibacillus sp.]